MRGASLGLLAVCLLAAPAANLPAAPDPMMYADAEKLGRPFSKDPSVVRFGGRYLLYFSLPAVAGKHGWTVGIAESRDLVHWRKVGELVPAQEVDKNGLCAPGALVLDGTVHLFYQSYGNGPKDAICHAWSRDGVHFERDPSNPVFRPDGAWNCGRAIDAEVFPFDGKLYLYYATRDPQFKTQTVGVASADLRSDFGRAAWTNLSTDGPALKPELAWEKDCIEAPTICRRGDTLFMFYAGAYNNHPQQIGCAESRDAVHWTRLSDEPFLPNGAPGTWNSSESGHPGVFVDDDGQTYLFYQGNNDHGHTWLLSCVWVGWKDDRPFVLR
ncbi:MAG: family 43 glycosylhydrolase [Gluconacetobacter diazotrophicus]|nr:family 43 glycosylhydrolase [Gluconacetobacter diazotrophicus]